MLERLAHALKIDPTELFSKACYPAEAVKELHMSVLKGFEQVVKSHIEEFEKMVNTDRFIECNKSENNQQPRSEGLN